MFTYLKNTDIVEIQNLKLHQLFRNLKFYDYCSYSLEELSCLPWIKLFYRPPEINQELISVIAKVVQKNVQYTYPVNVNPHLIQETCSPFKYDIEFNAKFYSPVFDSKKNIVGGVVMEEAKLLTSLTPSQEEELLKEYYEGSPE